MSGGPKKNDVLDTCEGRVIIRAGSLAEAKEILAYDPMGPSGETNF